MYFPFCHPGEVSTANDDDLWQVYIHEFWFLFDYPFSASQLVLSYWFTRSNTSSRLVLCICRLRVIVIDLVKLPIRLSDEYRSTQHYWGIHWNSILFLACIDRLIDRKGKLWPNVPSTRIKQKIWRLPSKRISQQSNGSCMRSNVSAICQSSESLPSPQISFR